VGAQRLTDQQLLSRVVWHYYLQYTLLQGMFSLLPLVVPGVRPFSTATTNPLTRFPLFLMGIYAGLLALRHPSVNDRDDVGDERAAAKKDRPRSLNANAAASAGGGTSSGAVEKEERTQQQEQQQQEQQQQQQEETGGKEEPATGPIPWPSCFLGCFPLPPALAASRRGRALLLPISTRPPATRREWARMATLQSAGVLLFTLIIAAADSYLAVATEGRVALRGHVWLQVRASCVCCFFFFFGLGGGAAEGRDADCCLSGASVV
jgi:hypothetical protein